MTLADYFQPLGLNFLQSPIQLHPSPPHPTPPLLSTRPQSFTNVWLLEEGAGWLFYGPREGSTRVPPFLFSPRASSRAGWQKTITTTNYSWTPLMRKWGAEAWKVSVLTGCPLIKQVLKKERFVTARSWYWCVGISEVDVLWVSGFCINGFPY